MKGIVFTEFLGMVDDRFGPDMTEDVISKADLPSGGVYTSVGTYDHSEIVSLVKSLSDGTGADISTLIKAFGLHLLSRFEELFPDFFSEADDLTAFLESVDGYIHQEVRKLYPEATLPEISTERVSDDVFVLNYKSKRMMGDLAEGLISGAIDHFGGSHQMTREDLADMEGAQCVKFTLRPVQSPS